MAEHEVKEGTIDIIATEIEAEQGALGFGEILAKRTTLPTETIRKNMTRVCEGLAQVVADIRAVGNFRLSELSVAVSVDTKGGVSIIGSASVGLSGTITLKFVEAGENGKA